MIDMKKVSLLLDGAITLSKFKVGIGDSLVESDPQESIKILSSVDFMDALLGEISKIMADLAYSEMSLDPSDENDGVYILHNYAENPDATWAVFEATRKFAEIAIVSEIKKIKI